MAKSKNDGRVPEYPKKIDEINGEDILLHHGQYGYFLKRGEITAPLLDIEDPSAIDRAAIVGAFEEREAYLKERLIKDYAGQNLQIHHGRFGPYLTDGVNICGIPRNHDPKKIDLAQAQALLANRGRPSKKKINLYKPSLL